MSMAREPAGPTIHGSEPLEKVKQRNPTLRQRLAALYYSGLFAGALWLFIAMLYLCWLFPTLALLALPYTGYTWWGPGAKASVEGDWPTPFRSWGMWRAMAGYFSARIVKTTDLPASQSYIFCYHPHGILGFSAWLTFVSTATGFDSLYPGVDVRTLTLKVNFKTALFREYLLLHGVCDVSRRACLTLLSKGKSILIAVGGGSESLLSQPGTNDIILRRRKGFVRMALRSGASLVPVYAFGETNTYSTLNSLPPESWMRRLQAHMLKAWGWTAPVYWGTGLFLPWGILPYPAQLTTVIGAPIEVPKFEGAVDSAEFRALVDKYHAAYVAALTALFHQHKEKYAKGERDLRIVE